jgi:Transposase DDE domain
MKARTNQLQAFAQLALQVAQRVIPKHAHKFAPKTYTQPQLLACLLVKEHLRLDYRGAQDLLELSDGLRSALSLRQAPDHSTLWWFAQHKVTPGLLEQALSETVAALCEQPPPPRPPSGGGPAPKQKSVQVALDSTGLFLHHTSRYFEWRARRERGQRGWLKWAAALWTGPQLLLSQLVRPAPAGDFSDLMPLASSAYEVRPFSQLVADAGYDSEANHRYCREELKVESLIPARNRRGTRAQTPYRRKMQRLLGVPQTSKRGTRRACRDYGQRWKAETLMSVIKRKWGECLSARIDSMQRLQALLRGVVYNLHRLTVLALFCCVQLLLHSLLQRTNY